MNKITRMLLIPEDQVKDPTNLLMKANIPQDRKIRFLNDLMLRKIDKNPDQISLKAIINSNLPPDQKAKLIERLQTKTAEIGVQDDHYDYTPSDFPNVGSARGPSTSASESPDKSSVKSEESNTMKTNSFHSAFNSPVSQKPDSANTTLTASNQNLVNFDDEEVLPPPISPRISKMKIAAQPSADFTLELGIRGIAGLVDKDDRIISDKGVSIPASNLYTIVNYLTDPSYKREPPATQRVLTQIKEKRPGLERFIINPHVLSSVTWTDLQKKYAKSMSRRRVLDPSEESSGYIRAKPKRK